MSIVIDLLLVAALIFFIVWFTKWGFVQIIFRTGKAWTSLFTTIAMGPLVSGRIEAWFMSGGITRAINNTLTDIVSNNPNGYNISALFANLPKGFLNFLDHYGISLYELEKTYGAASEATEEILLDISGKIAAPCAAMVSNIVGHIICYLFAFFFVKWLDLQIQKRKNPFFRYVDHAFGFLVGTALGVCVVIATSVLLLTAFQVVVAFDVASPVTEIYESSYLFRFINEANLWGLAKQLVSNTM